MASRDSAFAVKSDGSLWAWGDYGGSSTERIAPVKIGEGFVSVAFPLGLMNDGTLWEWGDGAFGEPALVGGGFRSISAGGPYLAAKVDGTVWAWGRDASAQPSLSSHRSPVEIGAGYAAVSAGEGSAIALKTDGSAWQWGWDCQGGVYPPVQFGDGFISAFAGVFALRSDGPIWSREFWSSVLVQLPFGEGPHPGEQPRTATGAEDRPHPLGLGEKRLRAGLEGTRARGRLARPGRARGRLGGRGQLALAGGQGRWNALGVGTERERLPRQRRAGHARGARAGGGRLRLRTAFSDRSLAIKADGTLWAWGGNAYGALGDGTTTARPLPVQVAPGKTDGFTSVQAASARTLAIDSAGSLWAWGRNESGELGDGTMVDRLSPVEIGSGFAQVSAADVWFYRDMCMNDTFGYTLAVKPDGTLWGWGSNEYGFLGLPTFAARPQQVPF